MRLPPASHRWLQIWAASWGRPTAGLLAGVALSLEIPAHYLRWSEAFLGARHQTQAWNLGMGVQVEEVGASALDRSRCPTSGPGMVGQRRQGTKGLRPTPSLSTLPT